MSKVSSSKKKYWRCLQRDSQRVKIYFWKYFWGLVKIVLSYVICICTTFLKLWVKWVSWEIIIFFFSSSNSNRNYFEDFYFLGQKKVFLSTMKKRFPNRPNLFFYPLSDSQQKKKCKSWKCTQQKWWSFKPVFMRVECELICYSYSLFHP